jgi:outer membrane protein assembly factor BamB
VFEETLIVLPGGKGTGVVALDRKTGEEKWRSLSSDEPGYAPPTLIEHNGRKLLLIWQPASFNAIDPKTGEPFWSLDIVPDYKMPVMSARLTGNDLFVSAIENTSARIQLGSEKDKPTAKILWRGTKKNSLSTVNSSPFLENGYIYGTDVQGEFRCVKLEDGSRMWETFLPTAGVVKKPRDLNMRSGTAFVVKNGGRFFIMSETGDLIIARLTPEKYEEVSRMNILAPNGTAWNRPVVWSHPAFAEKAIFARNDEEIVCVPLAAE